MVLPSPAVVATALLSALCACAPRNADVRAPSAAVQKPSRALSVAPEVRAACDRMYEIAAPLPGVSVVRHDGSFNDAILDRDFFGCVLDFSGNFAPLKGGPEPASALHQTLAGEGWEEIFDHSADGPDGTLFAFRKGAVTCFFEGRWDSGAVGDPELPPEDWYKVFAGCTQAP